ncbi:hypothetical protein KGD83_07675 [Nocardiopsis akebiae]|uniref:Uncharacterized protein n=1 Tax=Nocardiopsis akebiae TaxID=2831968 RepID=A0ABX8C7I7_9ACTN|nr:hypothetical protein [Nocardiopsis akebiae]QUX30395.1 hypothetical protein KGD83_07675 [Nocardiopsis akebiae]
MSVFQKSRRKRSSKTLRNRWTASFGISVCFLVGLFWLGGVTQALGSESGAYRWEWFFYSIFYPTAYWFLLKVSCFTYIGLRVDAVVVKNFLVKHVIPAQLVSRVLWEGGVDIVLEDGSKWWCLNLGGSLVGQLAGYPTNRRCAREIENFVERIKAEPVTVEGSGVVTSLHLNLSFLACASLASLILFYLLSLGY